MRDQRPTKHNTRYSSLSAQGLIVLAAIGAVSLPVSESAAFDKAVTQDYAVRPILIGAGGIRMHGGGYALEGSVGQAGIGPLVANTIRLDGGFWSAVSGTTVITDRIFANGFEQAP